MTRWHVKATVKDRWWDAPAEEMQKVRTAVSEGMRVEIDSGFIREYGNTIDNTTYMIVEGTETQVYDWVRKYYLRYFNFEVTPLLPHEKQWAWMKK